MAQNGENGEKRAKNGEKHAKEVTYDPGSKNAALASGVAGGAFLAACAAAYSARRMALSASLSA